MLVRLRYILLLFILPVITLAFSSEKNKSASSFNWKERELPESAPEIIITAPLINSVARPTLHIKARTVSSFDSCQLIIYNRNIVLGSYYDSADTYLDLSPYEGNMINITFQAIDKNNQTTTSNPIPIFIESSHRLQEIFQVSGRILDFNYNKVLVTDEISYLHPRIIDINTGAIENMDVKNSIKTGYLTSYGAIVESESNNISNLYEINNSQIIPLGIVKPGTFKVAGNYCKWHIYDNWYYDTIFLRNISTGINKIVIHDAGQNSDVAENGTIVYIDSKCNVIKFENNIYTNITKFSDCNYIGQDLPITDGYNVAFQERQGPFHVSYLVSLKGNFYLYNGIRWYLPLPNRDYQVNNKYCAYLDIPIKDVGSSALLKFEFRILDTAGKMTIIDSLPRYAGVGLDLLNHKGDVMYFKPFRNLYKFKSDTLRISSSLGKTYYRDSSWYIAIGRSLFKVALDPGQDMIHNSTIFVAGDSAHSFSTSDFTGNFEGPGQLVKIKITALPVKGIISKAGIPVILNEEISIADIKKLTYLPDADYIGSDSMQWNAYDGFSYTLANAIMILKVQAKPAIPELAGLAENYCINEGRQNIKISNYPPANDGYSVNVKLDNDQLTVSAADRSFSFSPATYPEGNHAIKTIFTNVAGSTTDTSFFYIKAMVTPIVRVTADITNVINLANPVTLTSTNTAGGGTSPLYTFAKDALFINILQAQSSNNTLIIDPNALAIGNNWIYTRMRTSENCYTQQTAIDSINITRDAITGITDPDNPGSMITITPNPFTNQVYIRGLNNLKRYTIAFYTVSGYKVFAKSIYNQSAITILQPILPSGIYFISIIDDRKAKLLGTIKMIKE